MSYPLTTLPLLLKDLADQLYDQLGDPHDQIVVSFYCDEELLIQADFLSEALALLADGYFSNNDGEMVAPTRLAVRGMTLEEMFGSYEDEETEEMVASNREDSWRTN